MSWPAAPVTVASPASSANLGPGFDALGLALGLRDTVEARVLPAGVEVAVTGAGAGVVDLGEGHLVIRAMRAAFARIGRQPPGIALSCRNEIPHGFGLGSSAAAIVAGVLAASALASAGRRADGMTHDEVLALATELEGHPDNVAACLYGGLTIAWTAPAGARAARLTPLPELRPVLCVPGLPVPTETARKALPPQVPHADAAANSARVALLVTGLTSQPGLLLDGTQDFLHQHYRAAAMPASATLVARLREAGVPAVISGAGPSVLALTLDGRQPGQAEVARLAAGTGSDWRVLSLLVDVEGARVLPAVETDAHA